MTQSQSNSRPSHAVYVIEGEGKHAHWTKIGAAWAHTDGEGFNLQLLALPVTGRLVIRKPKAERDGQSHQDSR